MRTRRAIRALLLAVAVAAAAPAGAEDLDDLLLDMQMIVLDGQTPPPFTLDALTGGPTGLTDLRGKVVMLYFWESG